MEAEHGTEPEETFPCELPQLNVFLKRAAQDGEEERRLLWTPLITRICSVSSADSGFVGIRQVDKKQKVSASSFCCFLLKHGVF